MEKALSPGWWGARAFTMCTPSGSGLRAGPAPVGWEVKMAVKITTRRRSPRGISFDLEIQVVAPEILRLQAEGKISSRELAHALNAGGVPKRRGGTWSPSVVDRMLRRGVRMGIRFVRRTRAEAASSRKNVRRRSRAEIAAAERRGFIKLLADIQRHRLESGTVITSADGSNS